MSITQKVILPADDYRKLIKAAETTKDLFEHILAECEAAGVSEYILNINVIKFVLSNLKTLEQD